MGALTDIGNNLVEVLATVPPTLLASWAVWFVAGASLLTWYRRAGLEAPAPAPLPRPVSRSKSSSRSAAHVKREVVAAAPVEEVQGANAYDPPPGVAPVMPREKKPIVIGDPFGDLATLLDQPQSAPAHRAVTDSQVLGSGGSPLRGVDDPF